MEKAWKSDPYKKKKKVKKCCYLTIKQVSPSVILTFRGFGFTWVTNIILRNGDQFRRVCYLIWKHKRDYRPNYDWDKTHIACLKRDRDVSNVLDIFFLEGLLDIFFPKKWYIIF